MTEQELREIEDREAEAMPAEEWEASVVQCRDDQLYYPAGPASLSPDQAMADRIFIAHAREDIPNLCKEVQRLQDELHFWIYEA